MRTAVTGSLVGAIGVTLLLLVFGVVPPTAAAVTFVRSIVYAGSVWALITLSRPWFLRTHERLAGRPVVLRVVLTAGWLFLIAVSGAVAGGVVLTALGVDPRERFWRHLAWNARASVVLTFAVGLAMTAYRGLRVRLDETTARLDRLRRFFSAPLADLIVSGRGGDPLASHRREVTVVFLDLRGFTAFAETAEPEDVMGVLREFHAETGRLVLAWGGTLERFTGDGMMIFFNDPIPVADHTARAARMALAMRERIEALRVGWLARGYDLDFGVGIAKGYATIGVIGFEGRFDYGVIGSVTNLAARLCAEAVAGQILASSRVLAAIEELVDAEPVGDLVLKGFRRPVRAFNIVGLARSLRQAPISTARIDSTRISSVSLAL